MFVFSRVLVFVNQIERRCSRLPVKKPYGNIIDLSLWNL